MTANEVGETPSAGLEHKSTETILDEADREHFAKSPEERKNFISAALRFEDNEILDTQEKRDQVMSLMLKHWRILDSSADAMRVGKINGIRHNIVLKENPNLSYQKPRPLNPIIREEVEKQLQKWEKQNVI